MAKKNISKVLNSGSPTQRMKLLAEDIARGKFDKEPLLTGAEFNSLSDSFKKPQEIRVYNKYNQADKLVTNAIMNLQGLKYEALMHYSNLRGYILVWNSIEQAELLVNGVLHEIKDPKERKRIADKGAKGINLLFSKTTPDKEGYVEIQTDFEEDIYTDENGELIGYKDKPRKSKKLSLWYVMNNVKDQATKKAIEFSSWRQAILDYMDEESFDIKTYKEIIENFTKEVYAPPIGWIKYNTDIKEFIPGSSHKRTDKLKSKYAITPSFKEIAQVDEEVYSWFKKTILENE